MKNSITKYLLLISGFLILSNVSFSQSENFRSRSSFGFMVGGSYYIGDLNKYAHFRRTKLSGGVLYRYYVNSRIAIRGGVRYGKVEAYDSDASSSIQQQRNLSFQSEIWEVAGGLEFNYLNYKLGNDKYFFSPYLYIDIGVFRMNPQTKFNNELVDLQPIGTEGQGSSLSQKDPYSLTQLVVPFGVGFKLNLGEKAAVSFEYGLRKTFTDYLDDVGGKYVDAELLAQENGSIASRLSDPSTSTLQMSGSRGNSATKDWYSMFGVMFTFSLGNPDDCFYKSK
ncbi:MAG: hypothetical protein COA32_09195 [Fluviicola sp.]|nr:MAG: hypothetical protein COA32_09195 [Fluviicola sp.]